MRLTVLVIGAVALVWLPAEARGDFAWDSELSPYAVNAELLVAGGRDGANEVIDMTSTCRGIHTDIDSYLEVPPDQSQYDIADWPDQIYHISISQAGLAVLDVVYGWRADQVRYCTALHEDGWLQADVSIVDLAESPPGRILEVTVDGETHCSYGEVLIVNASYYFSHFSNSWEYGYGSDWTESYFGGLTVTGNLIFNCLPIVDVTYDVAQTAEAVPSSQVNYNPLVIGLTGLDTWLWYDFSDPQSYQLGPLTAEVFAYGRTWQLIAYAWVDSVHWDLDCESQCDFRGMVAEWDDSGMDASHDFPDTAGQIAAVYDGGGPSDDDALAVHLYEEKGDYTVATATVWRGYYTSLGVPYLYDPVVVVTSRPYEVQEIRGVLTTPDP
jgi:hypothetical protein